MENLTYWNLDGVTLSGQQAGSGELVLLLHGFPAFHKTWERYMGPLSKTFQVVAVDMRGYYESSKPLGVASYSIKHVVGDLVALVKHLGYSRVRVVGHDWGGAIAWAMAAWFPDLVSHVAVYNCPHPVALSKALRSNFAQLKRSWYILFFQIPWLPEALIRWKSREFIKLAFSAKRGTFSAADLEEYRLALLHSRVLEGSINFYRAAFRESFQPEPYPKIACPALLFWGERDRALGKELSDETPRYLSGPYTRRLYPDHGHWSVNELVEETLPILSEFLGA